MTLTASETRTQATTKRPGAYLVDAIDEVRGAVRALDIAIGDLGCALDFFPAAVRATVRDLASDMIRAFEDVRRDFDCGGKFYDRLVWLEELVSSDEDEKTD